MRFQKALKKKYVNSLLSNTGMQTIYEIIFYYGYRGNPSSRQNYFYTYRKKLDLDKGVEAFETFLHSKTPCLKSAYKQMLLIQPLE